MDPSVSGFFHLFVRSIHTAVCSCGSLILIATRYFAVDGYLSSFYYEQCFCELSSMSFGDRYIYAFLLGNALFQVGVEQCTGL